MAEKKGEEGGFLETIKVILQALAIALVIRTLLFQPFNIPSGSMIPTLLIGDYVFVSKYAYGYSNYSMPFGPDIFSGRILASPPQRGDVVVFKLPRDNETDYIKRVIGLPGDRIQVIDGRLYINGVIVPREPIEKAQTEARDGREIAVATYKETLPSDGDHPGVEHTIIELEGDHGINDSTELFVVPRDHYFMMGDNRDNSTDSRIGPELGGVGYVPFVNLVGRAEIIFFSVKKDESALAFWRWPWSVRWDRLFRPVH
ncbi:signal peptidase I [Methylocystis sp. 9N]|uniref:Signal peptidase I n=1 Tax=Methylocystis borbori TaxID=3118750 RepID=A0ABU7XEN9_9HYPH